VRLSASIARLAALAVIGCAWPGGFAGAAGLDGRDSAVFAADVAAVRKAAERALRDAHYTIGKGHVDRVTGVWRRPAATTKEQATAIEELRRISRYDPVDVPDTRALAEYRVTVRIDVIPTPEGKTTAAAHADVLTISRMREGERVVTHRVAFPSRGVVEEETLLRIREHLGEARAP